MFIGYVYFFLMASIKVLVTIAMYFLFTVLCIFWLQILELLSGAVSTTSVPEKFVKSFKRFSRVIQEDDNFGELLCHRTASPVLQVLLYVIKEINKTKYASLCHLVVTRAGILSQQNVQEEEENEETIHRWVTITTYNQKI